ncbi:hypothetical protein Syun_021671 [Stephania yunnanensis]|uniref:Uncharacterized protein n=1 Tax=Stephania yunnanensis TaxID=152371 RepID=A0AAP0IG15_9MAGN
MEQWARAFNAQGAHKKLEEIRRLHSQGSTIANLEEQHENVQKSIDKLVLSLPSNNDQSNNEENQKSKTHSRKKKTLPL